MTENIRTIRPARAAIAAVLAFSSPSLFAQTVAPPAEPVVAAPQSAPAPAFAPAQPVVQPTPSVEERLDAAIAASEAEKAPPPVAAKRAAPKPVARAMTRKAGAAAPAPRVEAPVQREATPPPAEPPVDTVAPVGPAPAAAPAPVLPSATAIDPAWLWALGGGGLLLIGLAGAAMLRRRKRHEEWVEEADPVVPVTPAPAMPLMTPPPVSAPATAQGDDDSTLEAMVAAPPSPDNPFRTYAKRMTRAKFLLAQQRRQMEAAPAAPATNAADSLPPLPTPTQTVYRFGSDRRRESVFKPRTS